MNILFIVDKNPKMDRVLEYFEKTVELCTESIGKNKENIETILVEYFDTLDFDDARCLVITDRYMDLPSDSDQESLRAMYPGLYYLSIEPPTEIMRMVETNAHRTALIRMFFPLLREIIKYFHATYPDFAFVCRGQWTQRLLNDIKRIENKVIILKQFEKINDFNDGTLEKLYTFFPNWKK